MHRKTKAVSFMKIFIETLTGTVFEMRASPYEQVNDLKSKIYQFEGIPVSQQHILWQGKELQDMSTLQESNIGDLSTLQLVTGMRGGPISVRSAPSEETMLREMSEYVEANKDNLMESMASDSQMTLFVFRDGENINVVKVVEKNDGTISSLSNSNSYPEALSESVRVEKANQNSTTKEKMKLIREQMASIYQPIKLKEENRRKAAKNSKTWKQKLSSKDKRKVHLPPLKKGKSREYLLERPNYGTEKENFIGEKEVEGPSNIVKNSTYKDNDNTPYTSRPNTYFSSVGRVTTGSKMNEIRKTMNSQCNPTQLNPIRPNLKSSWNESASNKNIQNPLFDSLNKLMLINDDHSYNINPSLNTKQPLPDIKSRPSGSEPKLNLDVMRSEIPGKDSRIVDSGAAVRAFMYNILSKNFASMSQDEFMSSSLKHRNVNEKSTLVNNVETQPSKDMNQKSIKSNKPAKLRCSFCHRKTGIATNYLCRCGLKFCSVHRYPELHKCSYDYKAEGRKILEKNNPRVIATKVPRI